VPGEPRLRPLQVARLDQRKPVGQPEEPGAAEPGAEPVEQQCAGHRTGCRGQGHRDEPEPAHAGQVARHRQHHLAGHRRQQGLPRHQQAHPEGAEGGDDVDDEPGQAAEFGLRCGDQHPPISSAAVARRR